eukprot:scaffold6164_cov89-Skeletonema_dohrnii-CCMP3373.AAC.4
MYSPITVTFKAGPSWFRCQHGHFSSSFGSYRHRYNVVGDLMRPSETAASSSVDGHIVSHAVNKTINCF